MGKLQSDLSIRKPLCNCRPTHAGYACYTWPPMKSRCCCVDFSTFQCLHCCHPAILCKNVPLLSRHYIWKTLRCSNRDLRASLVARSLKNLPAIQEIVCNAGDLGSIPGSGRSPGEGNSKPLQYSSLGNPMDRGAQQAIIHGVSRVGHDLETKWPP